MTKLTDGSALFAELQSPDGAEPATGPVSVACLVRLLWLLRLRHALRMMPRSAIANDEPGFANGHRQEPTSADRLVHQPTYGFASFANEATS